MDVPLVILEHTLKHFLVRIYVLLNTKSNFSSYFLYFFERRNSMWPYSEVARGHKRINTFSTIHYVHKQSIPWMLLFGIQNMFSTEIIHNFFLSLSPCLVIQRKVCDLALIYVLRKKFTSNNEGQKFWLVSPHS